jgi:choline-sulfatase
MPLRRNSQDKRRSFPDAERTQVDENPRKPASICVLVLAAGDCDMNFIYYMPETMRAESLGCYGHPLVRTPNVDRLAREGVRFDACYAQFPVCGPSRCSLMTGWYPHVTGCRTNHSFLHPHQPSLFRYLKEEGYHVEWHGKNDLYAADYFPLAVSRSTGGYPLEPGEKMFDVHFGEPVVPYDEPGSHSFLFKPYEGDWEDYGDVGLVRRAVEFLRSRKPGDPPFMLYLPLAFVHPPYSVTRPYYDMYDPDEVPELRPIGLPGKPESHRIIREYHALDALEPETLRKINAVYLGMTTFADHVFGTLMDALDETGLGEETAVFYFSDHGDYAGDYGLVHKHNANLEDVMIRMPLIARVPGMARSHTVAEPVELFDLMATTLELAEIEPRHTHFACSLVPQLEGAPGDPDRVVFGEGGIATPPREYAGSDREEEEWSGGRIYAKLYEMRRDHPRIHAPVVMARTARHKLIYRPEGQSELYDMHSDPRELDNLYDDPASASLRGQLERRILDWYVRTADVTSPEIDSREVPLIP